jgi:hypothetical protein
MATPEAFLIAYKGHFTCTEREMDRIVTFVQDNPTPHGEAKIEECFVKLKKFGVKIEDVCLELLRDEALAQREKQP